MNTVNTLLSNNVPRLTADNFASNGAITRPEYKSGIVVVLFYTPTCRFCIQLAPEYNKLASTATDYRVAAVDLSSERSLMNYKSLPYDLNKVPTVVIFKNGQPCSIYLGQRDAASLKSYVTDIRQTKQCDITA